MLYLFQFLSTVLQTRDSWALFLRKAAQWCNKLFQKFRSDEHYCLAFSLKTPIRRLQSVNLSIACWSLTELSCSSYVNKKPGIRGSKWVDYQKRVGVVKSYIRVPCSDTVSQSRIHGRAVKRHGERPPSALREGAVPHSVREAKGVVSRTLNMEAQRG